MGGVVRDKEREVDPLSEVNSHRPNNLCLGVDIGGTFTDLVAMDDAGSVSIAKTPSTPREPAQAVERVMSLLAERLGLPVAGLPRRCSLMIPGSATEHLWFGTCAMA